MFSMKSIIVASFLSIMSLNAMADTRIVISPAPQNREVVVPPRGYLTCQQIPGSYHHGVWHTQHAECRYARSRGVWVAGHWRCLKISRSNGMCTHWDWVQSKWHGKHLTAYTITPPSQPMVRTVVVQTRQPAAIPVQPASHPVQVVYTR